jgi:tetratricopeptide (TPR) repeat protein
MNFLARIFGKHNKSESNQSPTPYDVSEKPFHPEGKVSILSSVNDQPTTIELEGRDARQLMIDLQQVARLDERLKTLMRAQQFHEAAECGTAVLEIDKRIGDEARIAADYGNLGNVLMALDRFDEAEKIIREGLRLDVAAGRKLSIGIHRYNLGRIYSKRNNRQGAIEEVKKSLDLLRGTAHEPTVRKLLSYLQNE